MADLSLLVGREEERARLVELLSRVAAGSGGIVLVSGESGIGKGRLVETVLADWEGRCVGASISPGAAPYGLVAATLNAAGCPAVDGVDSAEQARASWTDAVASMGDRPTVVVWDDLQLADAATLDLVPLLAQALESVPVLVIGIYRTDSLSRANPIRRMRAELRRRHQLLELSLRSLTQEETGRMLAALVGPPSPKLVEAVHRRTDGLPFFVTELAESLRDAGGLTHRDGVLELAADAELPLPESVVDAVLARTDDLVRNHEEAVEYAATLGSHVDLPALAALAGPDEVDELLAAGLLVEFDGQVAAFRHALVRESLHRSIPWARRRRRHEEVAELL